MVFYNFIQYELTIKVPIYCLFNFDYKQYSIDFHIESTSKYIIFTDFWNRVGFDYSKPYIVPNEFTKYFFAITQEMIGYLNHYGFFHDGFLSLILPPTYVSYDDLEQNQFDMIEYTDEQVKRVQDYYYDAEGIIYSKYNFDFDKFSTDFSLFGSNLLQMTDFIIRNKALSGVITLKSSNGYGLYEGFKQYFVQQSDRKVFQQYLIENSISSVLRNVPKNIFNIDYAQYVLINKLQIPVEEAPNQFLETGQFIQYIVPLLPNITSELNKLKQISCVVSTEKSYTSGFMINIPDIIPFYIVTTYHSLFDGEEQFYIYASFQKTDLSSLETLSFTAQFHVVGIDRISDIVLARFEESLAFNVSNGITNSSFDYLYPQLLENSLSITRAVEEGDEVYTIGNVTNNSVQSIQKGYVMNGLTNGSINDTFRPPTFLIDSYLSSAVSGSPVFSRKDKISPYQIVGMVKDKLTDSPQTYFAINSTTIYSLTKSMNLVYVNESLTNPNDTVSINRVISNNTGQYFLGIIGTKYYYRLYPANGSIPEYSKYPSLQNLNITGGILVTDFILGYDFIMKNVITTAKDLNKRNIFKIEGPLLNSQIYDRFLKTNNPILLYEMTYFDSVQSNYQTIQLGKYSNQRPLSEYLYGIANIATFLSYDESGKLQTKNQYGMVNIGYYWYNGQEWVYDEELIGGNGPEWYVTYNDRNGNVWKDVHKFQFPPILNPYVKTIFSNLMDNSHKTINLTNKKIQYYTCYTCWKDFPSFSDLNTHWGKTHAKDFYKDDLDYYYRTYEPENYDAYIRGELR